MNCFTSQNYWRMEEIKRKENRENWICRYWLQIESCRECLFDALCSLEDRKNEQERRNPSQIGMDN